jgi:hypothetical protein
VTDRAIIKIPIESLSQEALDGVIDDFVTREGTDYGHRDIDLAQKRETVRRQLRSGRAMITYDPDSKTTTIVAVAF